jgi:hypothetical protein
MAKPYTFVDSMKLEFLARVGDRIYYTTDGSAPDTNSMQYADSLWIYENTEINAFKRRENAIDSDVQHFTITKLN